MPELLMSCVGLPFIIAGFIILLILASAIRVLREYERAVIFRLGRLIGAKGPGLIILIPGLQKMTKVDLRVVVMDVPTQDVISRDNVSVKVNAVIYFRNVDPEKAVIRVAAMRKLMHLAYGVLKNKQPFDPAYAA